MFRRRLVRNVFRDHGLHPVRGDIDRAIEIATHHGVRVDPIVAEVADLRPTISSRGLRYILDLVDERIAREGL